MCGDFGVIECFLSGDGCESGSGIVIFCDVSFDDSGTSYDPLVGSVEGL